jgi:hypothetical protein
VAVTDKGRIYPTEGSQMNIGKTHGASRQEWIPASLHFSRKISFVVNLLKLILLQSVILYVVSCVLQCLWFRNVRIVTEASAVWLLDWIFCFQLLHSY